MIDKILYYLKTTPEKRAADRAEYDALVRKYEKQLGKVAATEAALHSPVLSDAEFRTSEKFCIMHRTVRVNDYLNDSLNGHLPMMAQEQKCSFYRPYKRNGACWRGLCPCNAKNLAYFAARKYQQKLEHMLDMFWTKKYARAR